MDGRIHCSYSEVKGLKTTLLCVLQVSENLMWNWRPTEDWRLPLAVFDIDGDAEQAYMHLLHKDQQGTTV